MTIFEYIKENATIEELALLFLFLENDSGYYSKNNIDSLEYLGTTRLMDIKEFDIEDQKWYKYALEKLNSELVFDVNKEEKIMSDEEKKAIDIVVTAYEKEKDKNKKAIDFINDKNNYFEDGENWQNILKIKEILEE